MALPAGAARAADGPSLLQLGLFQREGDAWWAWDSLRRRSPDLADGLNPAVVPLDARRQGEGVALRATAPVGLDVTALCRRMLGAGFGCLVLDAPSAPPPAPSLPAPPQASPQAPETRPPADSAQLPCPAPTWTARPTARSPTPRKPPGPWPPSKSRCAARAGWAR
ncbi:hypothetical protein [Azospirillum sp. Marseille-Q6669]